MTKRWMALLIVLSIAGCSPRPASREDRPALIEETYKASGFSIPALDGSGGNISLADYQGQVVLLDFWATWCPPCRVELPVLNKLHAEYKDRGFTVIGMTVDEGAAAEVQKAVSRFPLSYPVGLAGEEARAVYGGIRAVPTKFLLDREGNIRQHYEGVVPESVLRADVESLLDAKAQGGQG